MAKKSNSSTKVNRVQTSKYDSRGRLKGRMSTSVQTRTYSTGQTYTDTRIERLTVNEERQQRYTYTGITGFGFFVVMLLILLTISPAVEYALTHESDILILESDGSFDPLVYDLVISDDHLEMTETLGSLMFNKGLGNISRFIDETFTLVSNVKDFIDGFILVFDWSKWGIFS